MDDLTEVIPKLPVCAVCNHKLRFHIQTRIDNGDLPANLGEEYNIPSDAIREHINKNHRRDLILWGAVDATIRKKGILIGRLLIKIMETIQQRLDAGTMKDSDLLKSMELFTRISGDWVDKREVTVKKSAEEALEEYLGENAK